MSRVYIGGMSHRARERDVERFLRNYGRIRDIAMKNGFAFIDMENSRDAEDAAYHLDGKEFMGERVTCEIARGTPHGRDRDRWGSGGSRGGGGGGGGGRRDRSPRNDRPGWMDKYGPPTRTNYRVIVSNLSTRVSWQDLKDYIRQSIEVSYADAHKSRKGEGCVEFNSYDDMKHAIDKFNGAELNGKKISLYEENAGSRSRSPRRSRSRSPRRSRSRSSSPAGRRGGNARGRRYSRSHSRSKERESRSRSRTRSKSPLGRNDDSGSVNGGRRMGSEENNPRNSRSRSRSRGTYYGNGEKSRSRTVSPPPQNDRRSRSEED